MSDKQTIFELLAEEFPQAAIHWRAQQLTNDGNKAMALAYLNSRDVQDRLDAVCTPSGWQCEHYDVGNKTACKIGIYIKNKNDGEYGQWVWKTDGAGETQIEAEKGAFSGAFKRAAVMWGIGRYLYDMPTIWAPCETYEKNSKKYWKRWKGDPWDIVGGKTTSVKKGMYPHGTTKLKERLAAIMEDFRTAEDMDALAGIAGDNKQELDFAKIDLPVIHAETQKAYQERKRELTHNVAAE